MMVQNELRNMEKMDRRKQRRQERSGMRDVVSLDEVVDLTGDDEDPGTCSM